ATWRRDRSRRKAARPGRFLPGSICFTLCRGSIRESSQRLSLTALRAVCAFRDFIVMQAYRGRPTLGSQFDSRPLLSPACLRYPLIPSLLSPFPLSGLFKRFLPGDEPSLRVLCA